MLTFKSLDEIPKHQLTQDWIAFVKEVDGRIKSKSIAFDVSIIDYKYKIECLRRLLDETMLNALQRNPMDESVADSIRELLNGKEA